MAKYKLQFKRSAVKELRGFSRQDVNRVLKRIDALAINPRGEGCIKLTGSDCYRARVGAYRIVYEIRDEELVILVIKVGHRSAIYNHYL